MGLVELVCEADDVVSVDRCPLPSTIIGGRSDSGSAVLLEEIVGSAAGTAVVVLAVVSTAEAEEDVP